MTNVGEVIGPRTFSPSPMPCVRVVLPAPRPPDSTTRSPARSTPASRTPRSRIACAVCAGTVLCCPLTRAPRTASARSCGLPPVDAYLGEQPAQRVGDRIRMLEHQDVPGHRHLDQLGAGDRGGDRG